MRGVLRVLGSRPTVRRLMLAVAVIALGLGGTLEAVRLRRVAYSRRLASLFEEYERSSLAAAAEDERQAARTRDPAWSSWYRSKAASDREAGELFGAMRRWHERALLSRWPRLADDERPAEASANPLPLAPLPPGSP